MMFFSFQIVPAFLKPAGQLLSIHRFQQVSLVFAVMSRRRHPDYIAVLAAVREALPQHSAVEMFMIDFEVGKSLSNIFVVVHMKSRYDSSTCYPRKTCIEKQYQKSLFDCNLNIAYFAVAEGWLLPDIG